MAAISALSVIAVARRFCQNAGIIFFFHGGGFVSNRRIHMLGGVEAHHDAGHSRSCERVVDALYRSQGHAEGRSFRGKQASARIALHDGDANLVLFTKLVKFCPFRGNSPQFFIIVVRKIIIKVFGGRKHVKGRIGTEKNHLDDIALGGQFSHGRIMGAETDVANAALGF